MSRKGHLRRNGEGTLLCYLQTEQITSGSSIFVWISELFPSMCYYLHSLTSLLLIYDIFTDPLSSPPSSFIFFSARSLNLQIHGVSPPLWLHRMLFLRPPCPFLQRSTLFPTVKYPSLILSYRLLKSIWTSLLTVWSQSSRSSCVGASRLSKVNRWTLLSCKVWNFTSLDEPQSSLKGSATMNSHLMARSLRTERLRAVSRAAWGMRSQCKWIGGCLRWIKRLKGRYKGVNGLVRCGLKSGVDKWDYGLIDDGFAV